MTDAADQTTKSGHNWRLYFLAWLDALEKLELLSLEIKHLQLNMISLLRQSKLQNLLDPEEALVDPAEKSKGNISLDLLTLLTDPDLLAKNRDYLKKHGHTKIGEAI